MTQDTPNETRIVVDHEKFAALVAELRKRDDALGRAEAKLAEDKTALDAITATLDKIGQDLKGKKKALSLLDSGPPGTPAAGDEDKTHRARLLGEIQKLEADHAKRETDRKIAKNDVAQGKAECTKRQGEVEDQVGLIDQEMQAQLAAYADLERGARDALEKVVNDEYDYGRIQFGLGPDAARAEKTGLSQITEIRLDSDDLQSKIQALLDHLTARRIAEEMDTPTYIARMRQFFERASKRANQMREGTDSSGNRNPGKTPFEPARDALNVQRSVFETLKRDIDKLIGGLNHPRLTDHCYEWRSENGKAFENSRNGLDRVINAIEGMMERLKLFELEVCGNENIQKIAKATRKVSVDVEKGLAPTKLSLLVAGLATLAVKIVLAGDIAISLKAHSTPILIGVFVFALVLTLKIRNGYHQRIMRAVRSQVARPISHLFNDKRDKLVGTNFEFFAVSTRSAAERDQSKLDEMAAPAQLDHSFNVWPFLGRFLKRWPGLYAFLNTWITFDTNFRTRPKLAMFGLNSAVVAAPAAAIVAIGTDLIDELVLAVKPDQLALSQPIAEKVSSLSDLRTQTVFGVSADGQPCIRAYGAIARADADNFYVINAKDNEKTVPARLFPESQADVIPRHAVQRIAPGDQRETFGLANCDETPDIRQSALELMTEMSTSFAASLEALRPNATTNVVIDAAGRACPNGAIIEAGACGGGGPGVHGHDYADKNHDHAYAPQGHTHDTAKLTATLEALTTLVGDHNDLARDVSTIAREARPTVVINDISTSGGAGGADVFFSVYLGEEKVLAARNAMMVFFPGPVSGTGNTEQGAYEAGLTALAPDNAPDPKYRHELEFHLEYLGRMLAGLLKGGADKAVSVDVTGFASELWQADLADDHKKKLNLALAEGRRMAVLTRLKSILGEMADSGRIADDWAQRVGVAARGGGNTCLAAWNAPRHYPHDQVYFSGHDVMSGELDSWIMGDKTQVRLPGELVHRSARVRFREAPVVDCGEATAAADHVAQ